MNRTAKPPFLEEFLLTLVRHFGIERVRASLVAVERNQRDSTKTKLESSKKRNSTGPTVASLLDALKESDNAKYHLLSGFYTKLNARSVLSQSQDIYYFAQLVGMKKISGKSRKDLIPKLMRFLLDLPHDQLDAHLQNVESISESQRQRGFSVLTDKLLGEK